MGRIGGGGGESVPRHNTGFSDKRSRFKVKVLEVFLHVAPRVAPDRTPAEQETVLEGVCLSGGGG